jgi:hypothetical protein
MHVCVCVFLQLLSSEHSFAFCYETCLKELFLSQIAANASRGLRIVQGPSPVKFELPDSSDPRSLKPGSLECLASRDASSKRPATTASVDDSIAAARAAMAQFKKNPVMDRGKHKEEGGGDQNFH